MTQISSTTTHRQNHLQSRSRRGRGYVTMSVLFFMTVFAVIMGSLAALTTNQMRNSQQGLVRAKSLMLAEAGMDDSLQRLGADLAYIGTPTAVTLNEGNNAAFGTFTTTVTTVDAWTRKVVSVGRSVDNGNMRLTALVTINKVELGADKAAIKSNGTIDINGTADIVSLPLGENWSNCIANGVLTSGNNTTVDGALMSFTGVPNGTGNLPSVKLETPALFYTDAMVAAMKTDWIATARAGAVRRTGIARSTTITGSTFIDGDIKLTSSDVVTLSGGGNCVVYVNGNVDMSGGVLTNGVTLIVKGTFTQSGQSVYKITPGLPTPTLFVFNENNDGVGIKLSGGGATDSQGIVYGLKGDVVVAGGATLTGAIYCGDPAAGVKSTGNFSISYPLGMKSQVPGVGVVTIAQLFEL